MLDASSWMFDARFLRSKCPLILWYALPLFFGETAIQITRDQVYSGASHHWHLLYFDEEDVKEEEEEETVVN